MAEFGTTVTDEGGKDYRVLVNIDKVPINLGEREALIQQEVDAKRYILAPPTTGEIVKGAAGDVARTLATYGPPIAAIGMGAARGGQAGAALGPWGALAGSAGGAVLGGILGQTGASAANRGMDLYAGAPPKPLDLMGDVKTGATMGLQSLPPVMAAAGVQRMAGGDPMGALETALGALGAKGMAPSVPSPLLEGAQAARAATAATAKTLGIDLTAYEQTGQPLLKTGEAFAGRSLGGAGVFRRFGERQTGQAIAATNQIATETSGAPLGQMGPAFRENRFVDLLEGRMAAAKRLESIKEAQYWKQADPASMVDISPLVDRAKALMAENPSLPSLQSTKLNDVLGDIVARGQPSGVGGLMQQLGLRGPPPAWMASQLGPDATAPAQMSLADLRRVRTALSPLAFPEKYSNAVVTDVPVGKAKQLYGAISDLLGADAASKGPAVKAAWEDANQFRSVTINALDGPAYRKLLGDKQNFYDFSRRLFNPNDPGLLLDAKATLSTPGWKLLQQQYWDYITNSGSTPAVRVAQGGEVSFDGAMVARNIARDRKILPTLFGAENAQTMTDLGTVLNTASRTMKGKENELVGLLIGVEQARGVESGLMQAGRGIAGGNPGAVMGAMGKISGVTLLPRALASVLSDPSGLPGQILLNATKHGFFNKGTIDSIVGVLTRAESVRANQPTAAEQLPPITLDRSQ